MLPKRLSSTTFSRILVSFTIVLFSGSLFAQTIESRLVVTGLPSKKGELFIGWFNSTETFRKPALAIYKKKIAMNGESTITILFPGLPAGRYAIALFLDENGNGKIDKNFMGIPTEYYGISNNVYPLTRAANFEEAKFTLERPNQVISIKVN
ncbi:MAG: DUF2141 domain-containing protein [Chitinophagaceae bacterium]|nr:DUF2141 domain-containing protein [Chitinophagaceae bacterium]